VTQWGKLQAEEFLRPISAANSVVMIDWTHVACGSFANVVYFAAVRAQNDQQGSTGFAGFANGSILLRLPPAFLTRDWSVLHVFGRISAFVYVL
jgi:hypothetical protein